MTVTELLEWQILLNGTAAVPPFSVGNDGLDPDDLDLALTKMFPEKS